MLFKRPVLLLILLVLALSACTSSHNGSTRSSTLPQESAADQRRSAAEVHTELGQRYMQRGQLEQALEKLEKALGFDPNYMPAHTVIAVLYERIGKPALAEKHYRKAVALAPDKGSPNNNLGQFLCRVGKVDESLPYFSKAVSDPFYKTPTVAYLNAGTCLLKINKPAQATTQLRSALAISPDNADALFQMARALVQQNDFFHARAFIQRFEALGQPRPEALMLGYTIEMGLGELEIARQYGKKLQDQFPESDQARSLQGQTGS